MFSSTTTSICLTLALSQDPLALCSGGLPTWCSRLVASAGFLFPFDCRRLFFQYTSLGISRALHIMQHRAQMADQAPRSPQQGEFRLGRIQRQKARIHRSRVLISAMKVMELCAGQKAILEVEFAGEEGTGTGPTLEFFTLVSRELQRRDLGIWYEPEAPLAEAAREEVYLPPTEDVRMRNVHKVAVLRDPKDGTVVFPTCPTSGELLTIELEDGKAAGSSSSDVVAREGDMPSPCTGPCELLW